MYDVTNRDSFLALDGWKEQLNNSGEEKIVVMLVGNKVDLPEKVITTDMGQEYARQNGWGFAEVSAKNNIGIEAAFKSLIANVYASVNSKHQIQNPNAQTDNITIKSGAQAGKPDKKEGGCCK